MGEPELSVRVKLDFAEKRGRLLEPPLTPPKLGAADEGLERHAGPAARANSWSAVSNVASASSHVPRQTRIAP